MKTILVLYGSQCGESTTLRTNNKGLIPRLFALIKEAPVLPPGVVWQKGMLINLEDDYSDELEVDGVAVHAGHVEVRSYVDYDANHKVDLEWFEARGWCLSDEHPTLKGMVR